MEIFETFKIAKFWNFPNWKISRIFYTENFGIFQNCKFVEFFKLTIFGITKIAKFENFPN